MTLIYNGTIIPKVYGTEGHAGFLVSIAVPFIAVLSGLGCGFRVGLYRNNKESSGKDNGNSNGNRGDTWI